MAGTIIEDTQVNGTGEAQVSGTGEAQVNGTGGRQDVGR